MGREQEGTSRKVRSPTFCLVDPSTGNGVAFCKTRCLAEWILFIKGDVGDVQLGYTKDRNCTYCYLCGRRCGEAPDCGIHDGECPERDYRYTYGMHEVIKITFGILGRPLDDVDMEIAVQTYESRDKSHNTWEVGSRIASLIEAQREQGGK
jgi:hypothetical protein